MPELPEISVLSKQLRQEIVSKKIIKVEVAQPKNLNMTVQEFNEKIIGNTVTSIDAMGKWLFVTISEELLLLINLGMGGELLFFISKDCLPEKYKFKIEFMDGSGFTINFWWFGYIHLVHKKELKEHKMVGKLGISPLDKRFTLEYFKKLLKGRRGRIKSFLLNQRNIAGIGNVYIQDILFKAKINPLKQIDKLKDKDVEALYHSMHEVLSKSIEMGGLSNELDFYGNRGRFSEVEFLVAYKTGKPCPECSTPIEKIRTGSTSSYICPICQSI